MTPELPFEMETGVPDALVDAEWLRERLQAIPEVAHAREAAAHVKDVQVVDRAGYDAAAGMLAVVRAGLKALEAAVKLASSPFRAATDAVRAIGKEEQAPLDDADSRLVFALTAWRAAEEILTADQRTRAEEAAEAAVKASLEAQGFAGDIPPVEVYIAPPPRAVQTAHGSVTLRRSWTYEVTDPGQVPREYCEPAPGLIMAAVRRGVRSIPGVRIFEQESLPVRRR